MNPVLMPMVWARLRPWPSCASKTFISAMPPSLGSEMRQTPPSVRVPSTSIRNRRIFLARSVTVSEAFSGMARFYLWLDGSEVISDFDEIAVGIAEIDRADLAHGSVALDRTGFDVDPQLGDVADDLVERRAGDEAKIGGAGHGVGRMRGGLVAALVKLDGLGA